MTAVKRTDRNGEWWVDFRWKGRRIRSKAPMQSKRGAEQLERHLRRQFSDDEDHGMDPFAGPPPKFGDFAQRWMNEYVVPNNRLSTSREKRSALTSRLVPAFGRLRLDAITTATVDRAIADWSEAGLSAKRIKNLLTVLRRSLKTAAEWGLLRQAPHVRSVKTMRPLPIFLSPDEAVRLVDATEPGFWRTLALFISTTGVRFGEAAALQWGDLHLDEEYPYVLIQRAVEHGHVDAPKTDAGRRRIPLIPETIAALRMHPRESEWVFQSVNKRFLRPDNCQPHLTKACELAGIKRVTWHKLRHTVGSTLMARGVPLAVVKEILGHTSVEMTMRYTHVAPQVADAFVRALSRQHVRGISSEVGHQVATKIPEPSELHLAPA
jgi:integrase